MSALVLSVHSKAHHAFSNLGIRPHAVVRITGLRNPCAQIESFMPGLLDAVLDRTLNGELVRKAEIMGVVVESGLIKPNDRIEVLLAPVPHTPLRPV